MYNIWILEDVLYCTRGHNFRLIKQHHTVNCYSNSVGRTVNVWNALPASVFDCNGPYNSAARLRCLW